MTEHDGTPATATSSRRALVVAGLVVAALTVVAIVLLTPWQPLGVAADVRPDVAADFTVAQVARAAAFRCALGAWPYVALVLGLLVPWLAFALLHRRARHDIASATPGLRRRWPTLAAATVAVLVAQTLVQLPFDVHGEQVLRRFGLSTQTWPGWVRDLAVGLLISAAVGVLGVLAVCLVARRATRRWPWLVAAGAGLLVVVGSAVYPLVVERAYNTFTPLPEDGLTRQIEQLAARDGFAHVRVAVSDASRRTTGENAHVSGLGGTRWVVLDDTLLARARTDPNAVLSVVAHELGHVVHDDVLRGTAIGALATVGAVLLLGALAQGPRGRRVFTPASRSRAALARTACLLVAVATTAPYLAAPVTNLVSRQVEASADVHALDTTRDVEAFVRMQQDLATTNLSRLDPSWWQTMMFATHPSPSWRIAQAREWDRLQQP